jgi:hypothetical protein
MEYDRLQGSRIMSDTGCRVGNHVAIWGSSSAFGVDASPPQELRCLCGMFYARDLAAQRASHREQKEDS